MCSNDKELPDFYRNAGRLAAILYILGCNDCHNENVIAHRSQLVLVDAETLLQGAPRRAQFRILPRRPRAIPWKRD
jgi:lantibiotic modifying enzyme